MLQLTRLSGQAFALNPDLIERAEATPDTVVTLVNGSKYVVQENLEALIDLVRDYRAGLVVAAQSGAPAAPPQAAASHHVGGRHAARDTHSARDTRGTVVLLRAEPGEA